MDDANYFDLDLDDSPRDELIPICKECVMCRQICLLVSTFFLFLRELVTGLPTIGLRESSVVFLQYCKVHLRAIFFRFLENRH